MTIRLVDVDEEMEPLWSDKHEIDSTIRARSRNWRLRLWTRRLKNRAFTGSNCSYRMLQSWSGALNFAEAFLTRSSEWPCKKLSIGRAVGPDTVEVVLSPASVQVEVHRERDDCHVYPEGKAEEGEAPASAGAGLGERGNEERQIAPKASGGVPSWNAALV